MSPLLRASLDRFVLDALRPVSLGVGILYAVLCVSHYFFLQPGPRGPMMLCSGLAAVLGWAMAWRLRSWTPPESWAHPLMALLALLPWSNSTLHMALLGEPLHTTNLMLMLIGLSLMLLDHKWFAIVSAVLTATWVVLYQLSPPSPEWQHYGFAFFSALVLSSVVHFVHRRKLERLSRLRIENRKQREQLEKLAHKAVDVSRNKSRFIAHMSHELRTPLSAIIGFAKLLEKNRHDNLHEKQLRYLTRISSSGRHLLELINQILDLSRLEADRLDMTLSAVDLAEIASETLHELHSLAKEKGLELRLEGPARLKPIQTDRNRLKQLLFNLLGNAIKFTAEGSVTLRLRGEHQSLRALSLTVADTGPGIPPDRLEAIFEPFEQVETTIEEGSRVNKGSGLGLAICRLLCERLGFQLSAESTLGEGSSFTVEMVDGASDYTIIPFGPEVAGTLAIVLKPDTDPEGFPSQSGTPEESP